MKGNRNTRCPEAKELLSGLYKKKKTTYQKIYSDINKARGNKRIFMAKTVPSALIEKGVLPQSYEVFLDLYNYLGGTKKALNELIKNSISFRYTYWDSLNPDCESVSQMDTVIRGIMAEKGVKQIDLCEKMNIPKSRCSSLLSGRVSITYDTLQDFCKALDVEMADVLKRLKDSKTDKKTLFSRYVINARKELELTQMEAALQCRIQLARYKAIEHKPSDISNIDIQFLAEGLHISASELKSLAEDAGIFNENISSSPKGKKDILYLMGMIANYKYVNVNGSLIEAHTFVTFIVLMFLNGNSDKYFSNCIYYLNNLYKKGNLSIDFYYKADYEGLNELEVISMKKKELGLSVNEISEITGLSPYTVDSFFKGQTSPYMATIEAICRTLGVAPSLALEYILGNIEPERDTAELSDIISFVDTCTVWRFLDTNITSVNFIKFLNMAVGHGKAIRRFNALRTILSET